MGVWYCLWCPITRTSLVVLLHNWQSKKFQSLLCPRERNGKSSSQSSSLPHQQSPRSVDIIMTPSTAGAFPAYFAPGGAMRWLEFEEWWWNSSAACQRDDDSVVYLTAQFPTRPPHFFYFSSAVQRHGNSSSSSHHLPLCSSLATKEPFTRRLLCGGSLNLESTLFNWMNF